MKLITKHDATLQRLPNGPVTEGWYVKTPKVGEQFVFIASEVVDGNDEVLYTETSKLLSVFSTPDGYIINTLNNTYAIKELSEDRTDGMENERCNTR